MMPQLPDQAAYYQLVWEIVRQVPEGQVVTFAQIAGMIATLEGIDPDVYQRMGPRWVGNAMSAVTFKDEPTVPWHRVINSRGGISLEEGSPPAQRQRQRLEAEGVIFSTKGLVDFNLYGWDGPSAAWLEAQGLTAPHSMKKPQDPDQPQQLRLF